MSIEAMKQATKTLESIRNALGNYAKAEVDLTLGLLRQAISEAEKQEHKPLTDELPPLPNAFDFHKQPLTGWYGRVYTEEQMRDYATAAVKAAHGIKGEA